MLNLNISIAQINLAWENPKENIAKAETCLKHVYDADIIVLPEMFSTGFTMNPESIGIDNQQIALDFLVNTALSKNSCVTASIVWKEDGKFYNRLFFVFPDGTYKFYNKKHLFTLAGEQNIYAPGEEMLEVQYKGWNIRPLVCYDLRFPVWCRNNSGYDLLLFVANWPERRVDAWNKLLMARAIENQAYVVASNRVGEDANNIYHSGSSQIIRFDGNPLVTLNHQEGVISHILSKAELNEFRNSLPFLLDRDNYLIQ